MRYIDFILKAKTVGLTLSEMRRVIEVAHDGANPCPEVMQWLDDKDKALERQIQSLRALRQRLRRFRHLCSANDVLTCAREKELCCLIEDLPNSRLMKGNVMRKLYSLALVLLVALGAKAATVLAATCCGCPSCPLCK